MKCNICQKDIGDLAYSEYKIGGAKTYRHYSCQMRTQVELIPLSVENQIKLNEYLLPLYSGGKCEKWISDVLMATGRITNSITEGVPKPAKLKKVVSKKFKGIKKIK